MAKKSRRPRSRSRGQLPQLAEALECEDDARRLALMLDSWRQVRAPTLADTIGEVSERLCADRKPPGGRNHQQRQQRWMAALEDDGPEGLGLVLDALLNVSCNPATERLRALARLEPDPRVSAALCHVLLRPPFRGLFAREFWLAVFELLETHADRRCLPALEAMDDAWIESFRPRMQPWIDAESAAAKERIRAACAAVDHELPADLEAALEEGEGYRGGLAARLDALFEQIVAEPADDGPRLVYADLLLEAGDPRGEFIALQCRGRKTLSTRTRAERLVVEYEPEWLGPLAAAILPGSAVWDRGFLTACSAWARSLRQAAQATGHPGWGTVQRVQMAPEPARGSAGSRPLDVVLHPALRNLRALEGLEPKEVRKICRLGRPLGITRLGFIWHHVAARRLTRSLLESAALPSLAELVLTMSVADADALAWFRELRAGLDAAGRPLSRLDLELCRTREPAWRVQLELGPGGFVVLGTESVSQRLHKRSLRLFAQRLGLELTDG